MRQDNRVFVRHDETTRLATRAENVRSQRRPDGTTETIIVRPGGVQVFNVVDGGGRLVRRYRRDGRGREINIIDNRRFYQGAAAGIAIAAGIGIAADVLGLHLGPPRIGIPRDRYIVDYDRASDDDIYEALTAPPIDRLDRGYSLEEIRYIVDLRDRMRRIDLDSINFEFGAWTYRRPSTCRLERIAAVINRVSTVTRRGVPHRRAHRRRRLRIDNLTLSDRRRKGRRDPHRRLRRAAGEPRHPGLRRGVSESPDARDRNVSIGALRRAHHAADGAGRLPLVTTNGDSVPQVRKFTAARPGTL